MEPKVTPHPGLTKVMGRGPFVKDLITTTAGLAALFDFADHRIDFGNSAPEVSAAAGNRFIVDAESPMHLEETKQTVFVCSPYWDPDDLNTPIKYWGIFTLILPLEQATVTNKTKSVCREFSRDNIVGMLDEMRHKIDGIAKFYAICDPESCLDRTFILNVRKTTKKGFETTVHEEKLQVGNSRLRSMLHSILASY